MSCVWVCEWVNNNDWIDSSQDIQMNKEKSTHKMK